ncbi:GNAT family N-acetyltransferase [Brevundimonas sp.]|uniref:GNAT family N-acetyltransferase n=1 Tax=Brevundimonas sp. TaxID=1871086 RepID=UPI003D6CFC62
MSGSVEPGLVEAWVTGWALSRSVGAPIRVAGGHRVLVGQPGHAERFVFPSLDTATLSNMAARITAPGIFLKAFCAPEALLGAVDERWSLQPSGDLMAVDLDAVQPPVASAAGYVQDLRTEGAVLVVEIHHALGGLAASGRAALTGGFAVFDKIITDPAHQRRGLGRIVMGVLGERARAQGAVRGVLLATPEGRALYEVLGWRFEGRMQTVVIPGEATVEEAITA